MILAAAREKRTKRHLEAYRKGWKQIWPLRPRLAAMAAAVLLSAVPSCGLNWSVILYTFTGVFFQRCSGSSLGSARVFATTAGLR